MDTKKIYVGSNLSKLRCLRGLKQDTLARALNVPQTVYSRVERSLTPISQEQLSSLAQILEAPAQFILHDDDFVIVRPEDFVISGELLQQFKDIYESRIVDLKAQLIFLQSIIEKTVRLKDK